MYVLVSIQIFSNSFTDAPGGRQAIHRSNKAPCMWPLSLQQASSGLFPGAQGSKQQDSPRQYPSTFPARACTVFAKVWLASASHLVKLTSVVEKQTPLLNGRMNIIRVWAWMQWKEETLFLSFSPP